MAPAGPRVVATGSASPGRSRRCGTRGENEFLLSSSLWRSEGFSMPSTYAPLLLEIVFYTKVCFLKRWVAYPEFPLPRQGRFETTQHLPRVTLRFTRGYSPRPRWGQRSSRVRASRWGQRSSGVRGSRWGQRSSGVRGSRWGRRSSTACGFAGTVDHLLRAGHAGSRGYPGSNSSAYGNWKFRLAGTGIVFSGKSKEGISEARTVGRCRTAA